MINLLSVLLGSICFLWMTNHSSWAVSCQAGLVIIIDLPPFSLLSIIICLLHWMKCKLNPVNMSCNVSLTPLDNTCTVLPRYNVSVGIPRFVILVISCIQIVAMSDHWLDDANLWPHKQKLAGDMPIWLYSIKIVAVTVFLSNSVIVCQNTICRSDFCLNNMSL